MKVLALFFFWLLSDLHIPFQTVRFKNELIRNITIKLGYANAKVHFTKIWSIYVYAMSRLSPVLILRLSCT